MAWWHPVRLLESAQISYFWKGAGAVAVPCDWRFGLFPRFQTSAVQVKPGEERKQARHSARSAAPLPAPGTERVLLSGF